MDGRLLCCCSSPRRLGGCYTGNMRCASGRRKVGRAWPLPKRNLAAPEREADDVKHRPRAATAVRHLAAAGSDGIMWGPQAVTERRRLVVNHVKAEPEPLGQSHRYDVKRLHPLAGHTGSGGWGYCLITSSKGIASNQFTLLSQG